jgi:glycosyltransferase involved in cell wall biosynthesis
LLLTDATAEVDIVIPSLGRASLAPLLKRLGGWPLVVSGRVIVVDDSGAGSVDVPDGAPAGTVVIRTGGRCGPAAARNVGWRRSKADYVAFLDDDVMPGDNWATALVDDLHDLPPEVAAVQGRITVPRPCRATDWQRNTARLEGATWITADLVVRRAALEAVGGFDERFRRAYREDTDLAIRLLRAGWRMERGRRQTTHPVRPAPWWVSVRMQVGNGDDVLLEHLHHRWRQVLGEPPGRYRRHRMLVACLSAGIVSLLAGRGRTGGALLTAWLLGSTLFAWERIRPGPRSLREIAAMGLTSIAIPPVAIWHRCRGRIRYRDAAPWPLVTGS